MYYQRSVRAAVISRGNSTSTESASLVPKIARELYMSYPNDKVESNHPGPMAG